MDKIDALCNAYNTLIKGGAMDSWLERGFKSSIQDELRNASFSQIYNTYTSLESGSVLQCHVLILLFEKASQFTEWWFVLLHIQEDSTLGRELVEKIRNYVLKENKREKLKEVIETSHSKDKERMTPLFSDLICV